MGKCANCEATLDPGWKFCIACGEAVGPTDEGAVTPGSGAQADSVAEAEPIPAAESSPAAEPIPSAIRPDTLSDDEPLPRKRVDVALVLGIVMAIGGGVLIIIVAIALFSPRG